MNLIDQITGGALFVRHKWITLLISILMVIGLGAGAEHLYFDPSYKTFFAEDNPERVEFESIQAEFNNNEVVLFVLTRPQGSVYNQQFLEATAWLTHEAWGLPLTLRVDSLSNFQHTSADEDDLLVEDLVDVSRVLSPADLAQIEQIALNEPFLRNQVVKEGSNSTGIVVSHHIDESDSDAYRRVGQAAQDLKQAFLERYPDYEVRITGSAILSDTFSVAAQVDGETIVPIMYLVIIAIIWITLRSVLATLAAMIVVIFTTMASLGVTGFAGIGFTSVSAIAPTIVLTLAVADSVHILKTLKELMAQGVEKTQAIIESMTLNHTPVFLTSLTTVIGFLGLNFSAVPAYHDLGNMTAIGVAFAYLFSVTTLPALMAVLPVKTKLKLANPTSKTDGFTRFVQERSTSILAVTGLALLGSLMLIPTMESYDDPIQYFSEKIEFRRDSDFTVEHLTGIDTIELALPSATGTVAEPAYLQDLDQLKDYIESYSEVVHVATLADTLKQLNKSMNADDPDFYRLPDNRELAAQYLLLYELSLPIGLDLSNTLNLEKSASRVIVTLANTNTARVIDISDEIRDWIHTNAISIEKPLMGSPYLMFAHISKTNIESMVTGTAITFLLITLAIMVALKSVGYGLLSVVSNVLPSIVAFGIWAVAAGQVDIAVAIAASATIGIIVDFSVHFLAKYSLFRKQRNTEAAIRQTIKMVAPPILSTAIILAGGFSILALSQFRLNLVLGALSALTIVLATLTVFLTLPALLNKLDRQS